MTEDERAALVERIRGAIDNDYVATWILMDPPLVPEFETKWATKLLAAIEPAIRADERERCEALVKLAADEAKSEGDEIGSIIEIWMHGVLSDIRALKDKPS